MKIKFSSYHRPDEAELSRKCLFVLDASVLLGLYEVSRPTRDELLRILGIVSDRLWVPHQAALEYHRGAPRVIGQEIDRCRVVREQLLNKKAELTETLRQFDKRPFSRIDTDKWVKAAADLFSDIDKELNDREEQLRQLLVDDSVRDALYDLLDGKVGPEYSQEQLQEIYETGQERYKQERPPGYRDAQGGKRNAKAGPKKYGDLVLWMQVLDQAKRNRRPVVLIIDDRKADWWCLVHIQGEPSPTLLLPRAELVEEVATEAEVQFFAYTSAGFMDAADQYLSLTVDEQARKEFRHIGLEKMYRDAWDVGQRAPGGLLSALGHVPDGFASSAGYGIHELGTAAAPALIPPGFRLSPELAASLTSGPIGSTLARAIKRR